MSPAVNELIRQHQNSSQQGVRLKYQAISLGLPFSFYNYLPHCLVLSYSVEAQVNNIYVCGCMATKCSRHFLLHHFLGL